VDIVGEIPVLSKIEGREIDVISERKRYTYEDYAKLPEGAPYQLIGGHLVMVPAPVPYHQEVSKRLGYLLYEHVELKQKLGEIYNAPIDVYLEEEETYQPDILFISNERLGIIKEDKIEGAPDMVIEILSPSTAYYDLVHKKEVYARHGVREYWIVDPMKKKIDVYENKNGEFIIVKKAEKGEKISSIIIHGFEVEIDVIF
jgi:Uma2 family endonuclease